LIASAPGGAASTVPAQQAVVDNHGSVTNKPDKAAQPISTPLVDSPIVVAERPVSKPVTRSIANKRSSGRFMDVIHPSTNMRPSLPVSTNAKKPIPALVQAPSYKPEKKVFALPRQTSPIVDIPDDPIQTADQDNLFTSGPKPLESPFIAGAVVEKRPLGAFATESLQNNVELSPSGEVNEKLSETASKVTTIENAVPLSSELDDDLLRIEAGNATQNTISDKISTNTPEIKTSAQTSISQQYKEQSTEIGNKTNSIYDTNVYHKDSIINDKKKSGWMWVLWIVILLAVGVGAGAITYFYILPLL
jgi:hypothetical protein